MSERSKIFEDLAPHVPHEHKDEFARLVTQIEARSDDELLLIVRMIAIFASTTAQTPERIESILLLYDIDALRDVSITCSDFERVKNDFFKSVQRERLMYQETIKEMSDSTEKIGHLVSVSILKITIISSIISFIAGSIIGYLINQ